MAQSNSVTLAKKGKTPQPNGCGVLPLENRRKKKAN